MLKRTGVQEDMKMVKEAIGRAKDEGDSDSISYLNDKLKKLERKYFDSL
jgi:hypothetical protein